MKLRYLPLLLACVTMPAQAGFRDDESRAEIERLKEQLSYMQSTFQSKINTLEEKNKKLDDALKLQTKTNLDLQSQIETMTGDLRRVSGQAEELSFSSKEVSKSSKKNYDYLDGRLRALEAVQEKASAEKNEAAQVAATVEKLAAQDPFDPSSENRAYETAYAKYKANSFAEATKMLQDFVKRYPDSVHRPNANFWLAQSLFASKDYNGALASFQKLVKESPDSFRVPEALFQMAGCYFELNKSKEAEKTFKELINKYPNSEAAAKAKKMLKAGA